ncbi:PD40 domain-containing protein [Luteitalea pratensis]|nr:PD40 domain-containing protein [Luteitalea pratensis]
MKNARLLVFVALPLLFIAPGLPGSRLSADYDQTTEAIAGEQSAAVVSTIAFTSTRDNHGQPWAVPPIVGGEIYFIDYMTDGSFSVPRRVTSNTYTDIFPALSPDGRGKIVFDSNRFSAPSEPVNTSDLFVMNHDGTEPLFLTRGGSPTWSPGGADGQPARMIAFHASAPGVGLPINRFPGSATVDSDIFVVNVDDVLEHGAVPQNLTIDRAATVDDDPNWSPDGRRIIFTSYVPDPSTNVTSAEIYIMNADGTGEPQQLTGLGNPIVGGVAIMGGEFGDAEKIEKRGPAWSPDGTRILFACRPLALLPIPVERWVPTTPFEICVMDAVANSPITQLTLNNIDELTPTWSPDGRQIVFHRAPSNQLWVMRADGTNLVPLAEAASSGFNLLATSWGVVKVDNRAR